MTEPPDFVSTGGRLSGRVYNLVKERLLNGDYPAGHQMPIDDLTIELGVSKQPVREAFRALAADGLLEIQPQVGTIVARYSPSEFVLFYQVLAGFEGAAAEAAAAKCQPDDAEALRAFLALKVPDSELRRANRQFHRMLHRLANSRLITIESQRLWDLSEFLLSSLPKRPILDEQAPRQHDAHWEIVDALEAQDGELAGRLMVAHIRAIADMLTEPSAASA